jgi:NAD(P)-dependent dehydrogenase (short-subunit alcohol dehydrogenase family)
MTSTLNQKIIVITGTTSGFGLSSARLLAQAGHKIYGLSIDGSGETIRSGEGFINQLKANVGDNDSVDTAVKKIIEKERRIDVLVNNAGIGLAGAIEETSIEEGQALFNVNFWGMHRMFRAIAPLMRDRREGIIINISSYAGLFAIPFQGFYSAAKYAVEGWSEAISMEMRPFNIKVYLVAPGDGSTSFQTNRKRTARTISSAYGKIFDSVMKTVEHDEINGFHPDKIGREVLRIINSRPGSFRHLIGNSLQALFLKLKHLVPYCLFETVALIMFGARDNHN